MVTIPMSRNVRSGCKRPVQPDGPTTLRCGRCFPPARRPRSRSSRLDTLIARSAEENDAVDPDDARSAEESEKPVEAESTALDIQSANYMSFPMSGCEFLVPEDDEGRLDLCNMYVRDEKDGSVGPAELEGEPPEAPSVYHCVTWDMEDLGDAMKNKAPVTTTLKVILVRIEEEQQPITWEEYQAGLEQLQLPESAAPEGEAGGQAPPGEGAEGQREEVTATLAAQEEDVDDEWRRAVADEDAELLQEFMNERILKLDFGNVFVLDSESRKGQRLNPDVKGDLAAMENPVLRITAYGRVTIEDEHLLPDPESVVQEFEAREAGWEPEEVEEQEQDFDDEEDMDDTPDVPAVDLA